MVFTVLRDITKNISDNFFFSMMADEATDNSNNEQLAVYIRQDDNKFEVHEDFIRIHTVENIKSDALVTVLQDTLIRLNTSLSNCRGQFYDGTSNMTEIK